MGTTVIRSVRWLTKEIGMRQIKVPLRAINDGTIDRYGSLDPSDGAVIHIDIVLVQN